MSSIAVIPARSGSKRLPGKNILDFFGKPMIAWTIEAAIDSACFDRILVSTDDEAIAQVARDYGADAPFLRSTAADDISPISTATLVALEQAESHWGTEFGTVVQLMANCPIRGRKEIKTAIAEFWKHEAEFQISCFQFGWMNPWWAAKLDGSGRPEAMFLEAMGARSQDLSKLYCPTGAIWVARATALKQAKTFYGPGHRYQPMHWTAAVDIDDAEDLEMAHAVYMMKRTMHG